MGGYGAFVWPAFGVTALILGWLLAASLRRLRGLERALAAHGIAPPGAGTPCGEKGGGARPAARDGASGEEAAP